MFFTRSRASLIALIALMLWGAGLYVLPAWGLRACGVRGGAGNGSGPAISGHQAPKLPIVGSSRVAPSRLLASHASRPSRPRCSALRPPPPPSLYLATSLATGWGLLGGLVDIGRWTSVLPRD